MGQRATIPTSVRGDSHFKSLQYSNYTLIALKAQMITALVISNQKLSIFVAHPLCAQVARVTGLQKGSIYPLLLRLHGPDLAKGE